MLRNLSIRAKLLVLLAVPLVLLFAVVAGIDAKLVADGGSQRQLARFTEAAPAFEDLSSALQAERLLSVEQLSAPSSAQATDLAAARRATDTARAAVTEAVDASGIPLDTGTVAAAADGVSRAGTVALPKVRATVDDGSATPLTALQAYDAVDDTYTDLTLAVADDAGDRDLAVELAAYGYLQKQVDAASREQLAGLLLLRGVADTSVEAVRVNAVDDQTYFDRQARARLTGDGPTALLDGAGTSAATVQTYRAAFDAATGVPAVPEADWRDATQARVDALQVASGGLAADVADRGRTAADVALLTTVVTTGLSVLVLGAVVVLALRVAGGIGRRLRDLAAAATEVRDELPRMVDRMSTPGAGPGVEFAPLPVTSDDEIGQVEVVINDLNETTFRIAGEQAALRASIAEMFVNVARRDQSLLARQLTFLDQLERTEENPDTLEDLFTLDHLATRMRRNAESLLVLAGINTGRRLRRPLPLSDVVRTAAGEIEHYDRVDLALQVDPPVVGHLALSLAHLVAELLENATSFSDPAARVVVHTSETDRGIEVSIADAGMGMSAEEVESAHERISGGRASEFVGAQRLGFHVVGRLAGRLDVDVHFETGEGSGTTVTLVLGAALFTPGSVKAGEPELAALDAPLPPALEAPAPRPAPAATPVPAPTPARFADEEVPPLDGSALLEDDEEPWVPPAVTPQASAGLPSRTPTTVVPEPATAPDEVPVDEVAVDEIPAHEVPADEVAVEVSADEVPFGTPSVAADPFAVVPSGADSFPLASPTTDPFAAPPSVLAPADEVLVGEVPVGEVPADEAPVDEVLVGEVLTDEVAVGEVPVEVVRADEVAVAVDAVPVDSAPAVGLAGLIPALESGEAPFQPVVAPAAGNPMPQRKPQVPMTLAAAQDILPRAGRRKRVPRVSATPPRTAAEAFWTSRRRSTEASPAPADVDVAAPVPSAEVAPVLPDAPVERVARHVEEPAGAAPSSEAPSSEAPSSETPSSETSSSAPPFGTPLFATPALETSAFGTPALETSAFGTPALETSSFGTSSFGTPSFGTPAFGTPSVAPSFAAPVEPVETPLVTAAFGAPVEPVETPLEEAAPIPLDSHHTPAARPVGDAQRQRSALAAEALSALTDGGSFSPATGGAAQPLVRRQAGATAAAAVPVPAATKSTPASRQRRAPADVRSMLSGFQAGVSRGRSDHDATASTPGGADEED